MKTFVISMLQNFFFAGARDIGDALAAGPLLVIAPHPDDETLGCGAAIMHSLARKQKVRVMVVTDGAASGASSVISPRELAALRAEEAKKACATLGVAEADIAFLNFPDGAAAQHTDGITEALRAEIQNFQPRSILAPYAIDSHADHRAIAGVMEKLKAAGATRATVYYYPIWFWPLGTLRHLADPANWTRTRRLPAAPFLERKRQALEKYKSQYEKPTDEKGWFTLTPRVLSLFFRPFELFFEK